MKIDAVITWVDGSEKKWQEKFNNFSSIKINFDKKEVASKRYNSIGEINFAIRSIIKFAPFVNTIYLVTDDQIPLEFNQLKSHALDNNIALVIIDHKIIFEGYEHHLPSFNSCSIGCMLHRIPNLANNFIIFNDDTLLIRETKIEDFFINEKTVIRGKWEKFREDRILRKSYHNFLKIFKIQKKTNLNSFKNFQENSAKLAGSKYLFRRFHTPVPIKKSTLVNFFKDNNLLEENIKYKFRNQNQFIISSLSEHLEIKNNTFVHKKDNQLLYFRNYRRFIETYLKLLLFNIQKKDLFMTIQSIELADKKTQEYILSWIENKLK